MVTMQSVTAQEVMEKPQEYHVEIKRYSPLLSS